MIAVKGKGQMETWYLEGVRSAARAEDSIAEARALKTPT
jgi:hypothetical protein